MAGIKAIVLCGASTPRRQSPSRSKGHPLLASRYTMYETCGRLFQVGLPGCGLFDLALSTWREAWRGGWFGSRRIVTADRCRAVPKGVPVSANPSELTRVQELVYELPIAQVMTRNVTTVTPACTIRELKELLRIQRISGVPVVQDGVMVGMISLENVIRALEDGELDATVGAKMTRQVRSVRADDTVVSAVNLFARLGYGRFPVVDAEGHLVGILTQGDIMRGVLRQMEVQWHEEEIQRYRAATSLRTSSRTRRA